MVNLLAILGTNWGCCDYQNSTVLVMRGAVGNLGVRLNSDNIVGTRYL